MMLYIVVICLVTVVTAQSQSRVTSSGANVYLLRYNNDPPVDGKYSFGYEQSDGQKREEQGELRNVGLKNKSLVVRGSYRWMGPVGVEYIVLYVADENGYRPIIKEEAIMRTPVIILSLLG